MTDLSNKEIKAWSKLDDATVNLLKLAFGIGADVTSACSFANITRQTYYNWVDRYPDILEEIDKLREKPALKAYQTIYNNLHNPDIAMWYLKKVKSEVFGDSLGLTMKGQSVSDEELETKRKRLIELLAYVKAQPTIIDGNGETVSPISSEPLPD